MKIRNCEELLRIAEKQKDIVVYGAGWAGKMIAEYFKIHGIRILCFGVTEQKAEDITEIEGISIRKIKELCGRKPEIILGAISSTQKTMIRYLMEHQIKEYYEPADAVIYELRQELLSYHAQNYGYHIKGEKPYKIGYLVPGYLDTDYAEQRLVIGKDTDAEYVAIPKEIAKLPCAGTEYENKIETYKMLADAVYCPKMKSPQIDLLHVFNMVCRTDQAWIASFETMLPRMPVTTAFEDEHYKNLIKEILKDNCKALLALCQNAYDIHKRILESRLPDETAAQIMKKTFVLHPPQAILISQEDFYKKHKTNKIRFIFLGTTFFMKGGREAVRALEHFEGKYEFELTLISSLQPNDYFTHIGYEERDTWLETIKSKTWITYYEKLPNERALEKCREATVGLFPSFGDTYGYALLEMQAAGCPVVSTNVRAFTETNNNECGWICELPVNENMTCDDRELEKLSEILENKLIKVFEDIFLHPEQVRMKGMAALERIKRMHDPEKYAETIRKLIG